MSEYASLRTSSIQPASTLQQQSITAIEAAMCEEMARGNIEIISWLLNLQQKTDLPHSISELEIEILPGVPLSKRCTGCQRDLSWAEFTCGGAGFECGSWCMTCFISKPEKSLAVDRFDSCLDHSRSWNLRTPFDTSFLNVALANAQTLIKEHEKHQYEFPTLPSPPPPLRAPANPISPSSAAQEHELASFLCTHGEPIVRIPHEAQDRQASTLLSAVYHGTPYCVPRDKTLEEELKRWQVSVKNGKVSFPAVWSKVLEVDGKARGDDGEEESGGSCSLRDAVQENYEGGQLRLIDYPQGDMKEVWPEAFDLYVKSLLAHELTTLTGRFNLDGNYHCELCDRPYSGPMLYVGGARTCTRCHKDSTSAMNVMLAPLPEKGKALPSFDEALAIWIFFRRNDVKKIVEILFSGDSPEMVTKRKSFFFEHKHIVNAQDLKKLHDHGVTVLYGFQRPGDRFFVPNGVPHQVDNIGSCAKLAADYFTPLEYNISIDAEQTRLEVIENSDEAGIARAEVRGLLFLGNAGELFLSSGP